MNGVIAKKTDRGFGFIKFEGQKEGEKDLFFHSESLMNVQFNDLQEGDKVTFDRNDEGPKGPAAVNVQRV